MATGIFEITLDLYTVSSSLIETKTFYTVFVDIGQKQSELPQKKSTTAPGLINFNEALTIKVYPDEFEESNHEVKLSIYSIHHYGRKKLIGNSYFIAPNIGTEQYKLRLLSCDDELSYIQFRCRTSKIQSRAYSRKSSKGSIFNGKILDELNSPVQLAINSTRKRAFISKSNLESPEKQSASIIQDLRGTAFQLPCRSTVDKKREEMIKAENNAQVSISTNLQLLESCEKVLGDLKNTDHKNKLQEQCRTVNRRQSRGAVLDRVLKMTNDLNQVHEKEDLFYDDDKLLQMVEEEKNIQPVVMNTFQTVPTEKSLEINDKRLKLKSHTLDFVYFDSKRPSKLKIAYSFDDEVYYSGKSHRCLKFHSKEGEDSPPILKAEPSIEKAEKVDKISIIKPKLKAHSTEQINDNDGDLTNIVRTMIDDVKGDLGYIKLTKLNHMKNKIKEIKDKNKHLVHANEALSQQNKFYLKKVTMAEQILKKKEEILSVEFQSLRTQFKEVTKKLLDKYHEEIKRQNQIKQYQSQLKAKDEKIKKLEQKLELKDKKVQHYQQLLIADEKKNQDTQAKDLEEISLESAFESLQLKKFERSSSGNKLFHNKRSDSKNSYTSQQNTSRTNLKDSKVDTLKGINPNFKDFFMTFISKPEENVIQNPIPQQSLHKLKKGKVYNRQTVLEPPPEKQQQAPVQQASSIFLDI